MGCGAAKGAKEESKPVGLSQADKDAIAVRALKDALGMAVDFAITTGSGAGIWEGKLKIGIPIQGKLDDIKAKANALTLPKVGPVGGGPIPGVATACEGIDKLTAPFEEQFKQAAMAVVSAPGTKTEFTKAVGDLSVEGAIALCRSGGASACVDYLNSKAEAAIKASMKGVVDAIMDSHPLTKAWKDALDAVNSLIEMIKKVPKVDCPIEPIEFDLNDYVLGQVLGGIKALMVEKEQAIRNAPGEAVSNAIKNVFGGVDPSKWTK